MTIKINTNDSLKTYVFLLLDKSGSMGSVKAETISHFNEQLQTVKSSEIRNMENIVSLTTFNDSVQEVFFKKAAADVQELTPESYEPRGMTCMLDAIGTVIDKAKKIEDINKENVSCLVVILSDGMENSSRKYSSNDVAERIQSLQDTERWTFAYIGANQDLSTVSKQLNIPKGNTLSFDSSSLGVTNMAKKQRRYLSGYFTARSYGTKSTRGFYGSDEG